MDAPIRRPSKETRCSRPEEPSDLELSLMPKSKKAKNLPELPQEADLSNASEDDLLDMLENHTITLAEYKEERQKRKAAALALTHPVDEYMEEEQKRKAAAHALTHPVPIQPLQLHKQALRLGPEFTNISWIERQSLMLPVMWDNLRRWMVNFERNGSRATDYGHIIISGGSGTGKTRSGIELGRLLSNQIAGAGWGYTYIFSRPDLDIAQTAGQVHAEEFLRRQLSQAYGMDSPASIPSLSDLLREIRKVEGLTDKTPLLILFQVDEFQRDLAFCTQLCRFISMSTANPNPNNPFIDNNTLIVPVFTGTWNSFIDMPTEPPAFQVTLSGFDTREDAIQFFEDAWAVVSASSTSSSSTSPSARLPSPFKNTPQHLCFLSHLGFIPRMLSIYASCLHNTLTKKAIDLEAEAGFVEMWIRVCRLISEQYRIGSIDPTLRDHILVLWYFKKEIPLSHRLKDQTVLQMQGHSYYFLGQSLTYPSVILHVPFVYCYIWVPELFDKDIFLNTTNQLSEENLPKFVAQLHRTTYSMLGKYAKVVNDMRATHKNFALPPVETRIEDGVLQVKTSLDEIYAHAAIGPKAVLEGNLWIDPNTPLLIVPSPKEIPSALERKAIFLSPEKHHGADLLAPHAAEQYKAFSFSTTGRHEGPMGISQLTIKNELDKDRYGQPLLTIITPKPLDFLRWNPDETNATSCSFDVDARHAAGKPKRGRPSKKDSIEHTTSSLLVIATEDNIIKFGRGLIHSASIAQLEDTAKSLGTTE